MEEGKNGSAERPDWMNNDRDRGMVTRGDREYLFSQDEYEKEAARNKRYRIRERISNALFDFNILNRVEDRDVKEIFESFDDADFVRTEVIEFIYRSVYLTISQDESVEEELEKLLRLSIQSAEHGRGNIADVTVDIHIDREEGDTEELIQKFIGGRASAGEFSFLMRNELIETLDQASQAGRDITLQVGDEEVTVFESDDLEGFRSGEEDPTEES